MLFRIFCKNCLLCCMFLLHNFVHGFFLPEINDYPTIQITSSPDPSTATSDKRNIVFISFGGPTDDYHHLANEICQKTAALGFFTHILGFSEADLKKDADFWNQHGDFIESNSRGYGYWIWKPYLINLVLNHLNENDILIYADAGTTINPNGLSLLREYIKQLDNSDLGVLGYQLTHPEKCYNKKELQNFLHPSKKDLNSGQMAATVIFIKKNKHSSELIKKWSELACIHKLIEDDEDKANEDADFIEHRHDQAIFSLLAKKQGITLVGEQMFTRFSEDWKNVPFQGTQLRPNNKSATSLTPKNFISPYSNISVSELIASYLEKKEYKNKTLLCHIMTSYGSDKSNYHNYTTLYSSLFSKYKNEELNIFEMGLGTNNTDVPSNMGSDGSPGASLFGWAEYFPRSRIYGADIDRRILFQKKNISTFYCDQTKKDEIELMFEDKLLKDVLFDVIIDDGLHQFDANWTFLSNAMFHIKEGGIYIIEDLQKSTASNFEALIPWLSGIFKCAVLLEIPSDDYILNKYGDNRLLILQK